MVSWFCSSASHRGLGGFLTIDFKKARFFFSTACRSSNTSLLFVFLPIFPSIFPSVLLHIFPSVLLPCPTRPLTTLITLCFYLYNYNNNTLYLSSYILLWPLLFTRLLPLMRLLPLRRLLALMRPYISCVTFISYTAPHLICSLLLLCFYDPVIVVYYYSATMTRL